MKLTDSWRTPIWLFKDIQDAYKYYRHRIIWDACCDAQNCLVDDQVALLHYDGAWKDYDYLTTDMIEMCRRVEGHETLGNQAIFMNPPYSNVTPFLKKAWMDARYFKVCVLVRADLSTDWFNNLLDKADEIILGRQGSCSLPNAIDSLLYRLADTRGGKIGVLFLRKRVQFIPPPGVKASSNTFPNALLFLDRTRG